MSQDERENEGEASPGEIGPPGVEPIVGESEKEEPGVEPVAGEPERDQPGVEPVAGEPEQGQPGVEPVAGEPERDQPGVEPVAAESERGQPGGRPERPDRARGGPGERRRRHFGRRKVCSFCVEKVLSIDYKDPVKLRRYLSDRGRIEARRKTGTCAKHQRWLAIALKRARHLALLPYTPEHIRISGMFAARR